jgi:hypothetical protein
MPTLAVGMWWDGERSAGIVVAVSVPHPRNAAESQLFGRRLEQILAPKARLFTIPGTWWFSREFNMPTASVGMAPDLPQQQLLDIASARR